MIRKAAMPDYLGKGGNENSAPVCKKKRKKLAQNLVYKINLINFAAESRAESRDRSFFKVKWFI